MCAACIACYFLAFTHSALFGYFSADDLMNMYWSMDDSFPGLLRANVTFWSGSYRPLGAVFYRTMHAMAGFHPFPFHLTCMLNLYLAYRGKGTLAFG